MSDEFPDILTIQEMAKYLRIQRSSLYKLAQEGRIPCQKVGRHWRFRRQAIEHWLEETHALAQTPKDVTNSFNGG